MKEFNIDDYTRDTGVTIEQFIGTPIKGKRNKKNTLHVVETTKGVFLNGDFDDIKDSVIELSYLCDSDVDMEVYELLLKEPGEEYPGEYGYLLVKNNKPLIISRYQGDPCGGNIFNNTFLSAGHDGVYLFNIDNPMENKDTDS
jgi:hypothetical protein